MLKGVTQTGQNEVTEQKGRFISILLSTLGASLLGNILTGKGIYRTRKGKGEGIARAVYGLISSSVLHNNNKMDF